MDGPQKAESNLFTWKIHVTHSISGMCLLQYIPDYNCSRPAVELTRSGFHNRAKYRTFLFDSFAKSMSSDNFVVSKLGLFCTFQLVNLTDGRGVHLNVTSSSYFEFIFNLYVNLQNQWIFPFNAILIIEANYLCERRSSCTSVDRSPQMWSSHLITGSNIVHIRETQPHCMVIWI